MADQLGSAVLTLTVDDRQYNAGLQRAKQTADQALGSIGQQGGGAGALASGLGILSKTAGGAAAAAALAGTAVAGIGYAAMRTGGEIQKLNAAFVGLTGSVEIAKQLRQELFTLSKTTPFKNEDILQAAQRFLAVGVSVNKLQGTINRVGAIAAQSGQPLERLALIYAQVYAKGRLQGEENLQLLEAGVDLTKQLSQVTGLSGAALQDAMSKGKIGVDTFNKALILATGDMSALQLAGQAVDVQFNNIFDNFGQLFGGLASSIAPALSAAFGVVNQIFDQAFPTLASIEELFAPLTTEAQRFAEVLSGNPELISAIAAATREWATIIVNNVADGLAFVNDILSKIDADRLTKSFIEAEFVIRKIFLAASALGAQLSKNAELTIRGASNPIQFGQDIAKAGGFGNFLKKEYALVTKQWNELTAAQPLQMPSIKASTTAPLAGGLDNKLAANSIAAKQNLIDAYNAAEKSAIKIADSAEQAKISLLEAQGNPNAGLNRYLTQDQAGLRTQDAVRQLAPTLEQAFSDASNILAKTGLSLSPQVVAQLRQTTQMAQSRVVGEINGRQIFAGPESVSQSSFQQQLDFIRAVQEEKLAISNAQDAQDKLSAAMLDLSKKDWTVQVNVSADGSSSAYGDVLNQAVTQ